MKHLDEVHGSKVCPSCGKDLEADDIYEHFLKLGFSAQEALIKAEMFGWTKENPKRFGRCIGVETEQYDGITWWLCPYCETAWKRFEWSDPMFIAEMPFPGQMRTT